MKSKGSKDNRPIQYQKGYCEFYKLKFKVSPAVLIPRPETELLVDEVLGNIKYCVSSIKGKDICVLDIGTGAGNIAISIAKNAPNVRVIATDISKKALKIARLNARLHNVESRVNFLQSNLLSNPDLKPMIHTAHLLILIIVTNLPYIPSYRIPYLDPSVKDFEPHLALDGGEDGFKLYRRLFSQISQLGVEPLTIISEIDYTHGELAYSEAYNFFPQAFIEVKKDLAHLQRILTIKLTD